MNLFLSWSGERSRFLAEALRDWLPLVLHKIEPWISTQDIGTGEDWVAGLTAKLREAEAGLICLTPENLDSNWIHYEAGALRNTSLKLIASYLYEVSKLEPPLGLFQAVSANEEGTRKLVRDFNKTIPGRQLEPHHLDRSFDMWWPVLNKKLADVPSRPAQPPPDPPELIDTMSRRRSAISAPPNDQLARGASYYLNHTSFLRQDAQKEFVRRTGVFAPHYDIRVILGSVDDPSLRIVERVVYHLHQSYPRPDQETSERANGFLLKEVANGEYLLRAEVFFNDGSPPINLYRYVSLWESGPRLG